MTDRAIYKLEGSAIPGRRVDRLRLSTQREVAVGENIELSENEADRLSEKYKLRKVRNVETSGSSSSDEGNEKSKND